jgi:hypothetical protein
MRIDAVVDYDYNDAYLLKKNDLRKTIKLIFEEGFIWTSLAK